MDRICSSQPVRETGSSPLSTQQDAKSSVNTTPASPGPNGTPQRPRFSRRIESAIQNATQSECGLEIVLHSNIVTGKELKRTLDTLFPGPQEYSVQLRRDRYRVSLPHHNKDSIQRFVSSR